MANKPTAPISVVIDGKTHYIEHDVFRRILTASSSALHLMKSVERRNLPKIDNDAIDAITQLQYQHRSLL